MLYKTINKKLIGLFRSELSVTEEIHDETVIRNHFQDSLDEIEFLMGVEEAFDIQITDAEWGGIAFMEDLIKCVSDKVPTRTTVLYQGEECEKMELLYNTDSQKRVAGFVNGSNGPDGSVRYKKEGVFVIAHTGAILLKEIVTGTIHQL